MRRSGAGSHPDKLAVIFDISAFLSIHTSTCGTEIKFFKGLIIKFNVGTYRFTK